MASKAAKGRRAKTRDLFYAEKLTVEKMMRNISEGSEVVIVPNGAYHKGLPFRRFAGKVGIVIKKNGQFAYDVQIKNSSKIVKTTVPHIKVINE